MEKLGMIVFAVLLLVFDSSGTIGSRKQWGAPFLMILPAMLEDRAEAAENFKKPVPTSADQLLPPVKPDDLPDHKSEGAKLVSDYCSLCHNIPLPSLHTAEDWSSIAEWMFSLMSNMHGGMETTLPGKTPTPSPEEKRKILGYLQTHAAKSPPGKISPPGPR